MVFVLTVKRNYIRNYLEKNELSYGYLLCLGKSTGKRIIVFANDNLAYQKYLFLYQSNIFFMSYYIHVEFI
jgi:hypothetical protein